MMLASTHIDVDASSSLNQSTLSSLEDAFVCFAKRFFQTGAEESRKRLTLIANASSCFESTVLEGKAGVSERH